MKTTIDRSAVSQALAKAIAYKQCGKDSDAQIWARRVVELLQCAEILRNEPLTYGPYGHSQYGDD